MSVRTLFKFTLPAGLEAEKGDERKVSGIMRLIQIKDLLQIERDSQVHQDSGMFYVVLLSKVIIELDSIKMITRLNIEQLNPENFSFLIDFLHEINHQVIKKIPITCNSCGRTCWGEFNRLGEA